MTHPILALQATLVAALKADAALTALLGAEAVFDGPPKGRVPPYVAIVRHDVTPRDGDVAPGHEHRVLAHIWVADASRKSVLAVVERVLAVVFSAALSSADLKVTHRLHERTDTAIDTDTGQARAALALRFFSEPTS
jgi:hypothetical protein